jgi:hypothetical protein
MHVKLDSAGCSNIFFCNDLLGVALARMLWQLLHIAAAHDEREDGSMQLLLGILMSIALVALTRCGPVVSVSAQQPAVWASSLVEPMEAGPAPVQVSATALRFNAE